MPFEDEIDRDYSFHLSVCFLSFLFFLLLLSDRLHCEFDAEQSRARKNGTEKRDK
jgi:hypothetical protein